ncbi:energy-coupling factor ABC transporter ATP-binding protein [Thermomicrobiaceae bacterium CFH 74404]|uniref:Energy-coupling factor ABC transporter ATP-binding protein n=1 Tax=Thermalbibacter longus TaxID=2951981 RepID=A0AA42B9M6_9BACT|nr:ABC transporter ATP-binding protein [Thermalbibacter longus]MCM8748562.1 energy-coupling factor ABC transporter ATP-binding protein [Thermalbibacter longus]
MLSPSLASAGRRSSLEPAVLVEGLTVKYPGRKCPALEEVSFSIQPGELALVLGPSGCGKSTLALCLNGVIPQAIGAMMDGQVRVAGLDTRHAPLNRLSEKVGVVFQDPESQFCLLTVEEEIAFGLENLGIPPGEMPGRIAAALELVGLSELRDRRIDRLSGGQKQRLALACVLAMEPQVLVLDEPTAHLDPQAAAEFFSAVAHLKATGQHTIIVIEHRLDDLMPLVDRVLLFGPGGRLLAEGPPRAVFATYRQDLDRSGIWIPQVTELAYRLAEAGVEIDPLPLTVEEAAEALEPYLGRVCLRWPPIVDPPERQPATEVRRLSYRFPSGFQALREVSLAIPEGSFFALVGPNGAGKSTLALHLVGVLEPPPGAVRLLGRPLGAYTRQGLPHLVSYVFQNPEHQFLTGTVYDEVAFGLRVQGLAEREVEARVSAILEEFGLASLAPAHPFTLSQGEKRRLSVATALVLRPRLLILDEPTFGQDRRTTALIMGRLRELVRGGGTVVAITHDLRLVAEEASAAGVLVAGQLAFLGPVAALLGSTSLLRRAGLVPPPLVRLGQRLAEQRDGLPLLSTIEHYLAALGAGR